MTGGSEPLAAASMSKCSIPSTEVQRVVPSPSAPSARCARNASMMRSLARRSSGYGAACRHESVGG